MKRKNPGKELYRHLRALPWERLWPEEVARFNQAPARERFERVAVIRAVGAVFPESGPPAQRQEVLQWLRSLLRDPEEKIRRYAIAALPKLGAGAGEEAELLALLESSPDEREAKSVSRALDKIGGEATLKALEDGERLALQTEQKVRACIARSQSPTRIALDRVIDEGAGLRIHLRGRKGLESLVRQEVEEQGKFRVDSAEPGLVAVTATVPFALADLFALRCFGNAGFVLGTVDAPGGASGDPAEALASVITSTLARRLFGVLTQGPIRYRLEFVARGHQRGMVRQVVSRAFSQCPEILNDAREAPWAIDVHPAGRKEWVELRPRLSPDPRLAYRLGDVPAASHPPLAACMVRLAGRREGEIVWDPFCGSGLELVERTLFGGVRKIFGTDCSAEALEIAQRNFAASPAGLTESSFRCCDFREFAALEKLPPRSLTLIITNPPLGRRVPIPNLRGLFDDLFGVAAALLAPGGRLVFTNPFPMESPQPCLRLVSRQIVDMGGFTCRLELYRKTGRSAG